MIEIFDNSISQYNQDLLENKFSFFYPWYLNLSTNNSFKSSRGDSPQFTHTFFENEKVICNDFYLIKDIFNFLPEFSTKNLFRIKVNLQTPYKKRLVHPKHKDNDKGVSYLYYVNDSDGPTVFYKNRFQRKKINPRKGRLVKFSANTFHSSSTPHQKDLRVVLNIVFQ